KLTAKEKQRVSKEARRIRERKRLERRIERKLETLNKEIRRLVNKPVDDPYKFLAQSKRQRAENWYAMGRLCKSALKCELNVKNLIRSKKRLEKQIDAKFAELMAHVRKYSKPPTLEKLWPAKR